MRKLLALIAVALLLGGCGSTATKKASKKASQKTITSNAKSLVLTLQEMPGGYAEKSVRSSLTSNPKTEYARLFSAQENHASALIDVSTYKSASQATTSFDRATSPSFLKQFLNRKRETFSNASSPAIGDESKTYSASNPSSSSSGYVFVFRDKNAVAIVIYSQPFGAKFSNALAIAKKEQSKIMSAINGQ